MRIEVVVSEKRPWKRIIGFSSLWRSGMAALALCAGLVVCVAAMPAAASPIYPNIHKVVKESEAKPAQFAPARAGWEGAEMPRDMERTDLGSAVTLRANKAALLTAALPDPRAIFAVVLVIVLMRLLRRVQQQQRRQTLAIVNDAPAISPQERNAA